MHKDKQEIIHQPLQPGDFHLTRYREIPDVGLLLDQTVRLVNSYLEPLGNVRITGSMVSNYVKQKIIPRPVKKLYYRGQIAALIFIALSKTVLSLEDTAKFLQLQQRTYPEDVAYDYFCDHLEQGLLKRQLITGPATTTGLNSPEPADTGKTEAKNTEAYLLDCLVTAITDSLHLQYCIAKAELPPL